ncbi:MAG: MBL fold metallo-hydrolase [Aquificota bacterium]|nr:MBL fold metallo-hydrolase [Aquificota bacterium]
MADLKKRLKGNAEGEFFVDSSCIDCSVCREIAPDIFGDGDETALVVRQPSDEDGIRRAFQALVSCPVSAIGTVSLKMRKDIQDSFPIPIEDNAFLIGYASRRSYGCLSYLIVREAGNVMVDSPRFAKPVVRRIKDLGGLRYIFLTHEDDVADSEIYAREFGAERIIHFEDSSSVPDAEVKIRGYDPVDLDRDLLIIPTPGHTKGHMVLLYREKFLFTGDHLAWSRSKKRLVAFKDYCWHSWEELKRSMVRLLDFRFEWVLPGHGYRAKIKRDEFERFVEDLLKE